MPSFRFVPLPAAVAADLRDRKGNHESANVQFVVADKKPGFPCRVCLEDAEPGEALLLCSYSPFDRPCTYWSIGPIFIHQRGCKAYDTPSIVPNSIRRRLLSVRAYDVHSQMVDADVIEGREIAATMERFFEDARVRYLHVHNARPGCYACRVERA